MKWMYGDASSVLRCSWNHSGEAGWDIATEQLLLKGAKVVLGRLERLLRQIKPVVSARDEFR